MNENNTEEKQINLESLEKIKAIKDFDGAFNALLLVLNELEKTANYKTIIEVIEDNKDLALKEEQKLSLINKKISALLKLEEYNLLLDALNYKEGLKIDNDTEKANIYFYKSIAYEALDEDALAIESLNKIVDNISRYALTNKYLKLAILYLKLGEKEEAKEAYDYASQIDYSHKNDMFSLVESDLYFANEKYGQSLDSFQSFFLKSTNKYKYLDRYILINIKLNRLDEAYKFYKKYSTDSILRLSKGNRYNFLKASLILLKLLNREEELNEVKSMIEDVKPIYFKKAEIEKDKIIDSILSSMSYPLTKYDTYKNIANKFFKLIDKDASKIVSYIEESNDGYQYFKFSGKELKPKEISFSLLKENDLYDYFEIKEDKDLDYYYNDKLDKIDEKIKVYYLGNEYYSFGYFIAKPNDDNVYEVLKSVLFEMFIKLSLITKQAKEQNALVTHLEKIETGFIKLNSERVEFFDSYSRKLFNLKDNVITFAEFNNLSESKNLFIDTLMKEENIIIPFIVNEKEILVSFNLSVVNDSIYAFIEDVTSTNDKDKEIKEFYHHSGSKFFNQVELKEFVDKTNNPYALIGLMIPIIDDEDSLSVVDSKLDAIYNYLSQTTPSSTLYYLGLNHFLIESESTDKRVLEAIYKNIKDGVRQLYKYSYSLREKEISSFISKALKGKTYADVEGLIEYGFYSIKDKTELVFLDNEEKRNYAIFKTSENEIVRRIKEGSLDIEYLPILNEEDNSIHYLLAKFKMPYEIISYDTFKKIITKNQLESKADQIMMEKVFNEMMTYDPNLRFIIPLSKESVVNQNFVKKASLLFKKSKIENRVILKVDNIDFIEFNKGLDSLKNAGMKLSVTFTDIKNITDIDRYSIIFMNYKEENNFMNHVIDEIRETLYKEIVIVDGVKLTGSLSLRNSYKVYDKTSLSKLNK